MWQTIPSISSNPNPLYRQIQHSTSQTQNASHPASTGKNLGESSDQQSTGHRIPDHDDAQLWIDHVKRRRMLMALFFNMIVQSIIVVIFNLRPMIYFWKAFTFTNVIYLFIFLFLQQLYLIMFIRHIKVVAQSSAGPQRLLYLIINPSTFCCALLTIALALWTVILIEDSITVSLRCFCHRMILFSQIYFIRRLINQTSFVFPPIQLPLETRIRSRMLPIMLSSVRYTLIFTILWHLLPIRLIQLILSRTPFGFFASLFSISNECRLSAASELSCIILCLKLFISWELSRDILEIVLTQSVLSDKSISISIAVLVKLLQQDRDHYTRSLGFLELSDMCNVSSDARMIIYRSDDNKIWGSVLKICLDNLNEFSKSLYAACEPENRLRLKSQVSKYFARTDDLINISQALSALVYHSIEEDEMGLVQRSFEDIVNAMLAASIAIEDFIHVAFDNYELTIADKDRLYAGCQNIPNVAPISSSRALDRALYRIFYKFYRYLKNFSFPQEYAHRLRRYAEFQH